MGRRCVGFKARYRRVSDFGAARPTLGSQSILSLQRIIVVLIETPNIVSAEAFVADLQPDSERVHRRKFLDRESNGFAGTCETSTCERLA